MSSLVLHPLSIKATRAFQDRFGCAPAVLVHAPGRINLIGEHTDYNDGFVLPAAIAQRVCFAIGTSTEFNHEWYAIDTNEQASISVATSAPTGMGWADYLLGAYRILFEPLNESCAVRCVFTSDLPAGAGLSSSSALTCGFLLGLNTLFDLKKDREALAWDAHLVEHDFIGLQGGIMDQHACLLCKPHHFLLLDCLDRTYQHIPLPATPEIHLFLIDTRVQHKLTESDYNTRAAECRRALTLLKDALGVMSFRDISLAQLEDQADLLGPLLMQRISFVFHENARVMSAVELIRQGDLFSLGQLLYASHAGLRDAYQVSCPELDFLVDAVSHQEGILGARMMGGGFGGCTINLAMHAPDGLFKKRILTQYKQRFGLECDFIDITLAESAMAQLLS